MGDVPGELWILEMGALRSRQRHSGRDEPLRLSEQVTGRALFLEGYSGHYGREAGIEGPAGIIGDEGDEDLDLELDLDVGPEKEGGEQGPWWQFFSPNK